MALHYIPDLIYDGGPAGFGELINNLFLKMGSLERGQIIEVIFNDPSAKEDLQAWCRMQNLTILDKKDFGSTSYYFIKKC